jgi:hypothetical protein
VTDSARKREALYQAARTYNKILPDANDRDLSNQHWVDESKALECLYHAFSDTFGGQDEANKLDDEMRAVFFNTEDRTRAYLVYNGQLGPGGGLPPNDGSTCDTDPSTLPN